MEREVNTDDELQLSSTRRRASTSSQKPDDELTEATRSSPNLRRRRSSEHGNAGFAEGSGVAKHDERHDQPELATEEDQETVILRRQAASEALHPLSSAVSSVEADTCRICGEPGDSETPLYHPCKCSGTIRHVHQSCLKSWLDTSHRIRCDLCNHTFSYKKMYSQDMPSSLPARVLVLPMLKQLVQASLVVFRLIVVSHSMAGLASGSLALVLEGWLLAKRLCLYYLELYGARHLNATDTNTNAFIMPSTSFSTSLAEAFAQTTSMTSNYFPASTPSTSLDPISILSSLQAVLETRLSTPTEGGPTPTLNPTELVMAEAVSQIASILQKPKFQTRSPPNHRTPLSKEEYETLQKLVMNLTGKQMFRPASSFVWDGFKLWYTLLARFGEWVVSAIVGLMLGPFTALRDLFSFLQADESATTWQKVESLANTISEPIVTGQMIAIGIVVAFVLLFFLREWVVVNAEPGMFDNAAAADGPGIENGNGDAAGQDPAPQNNLDEENVPGAFPVDVARDAARAARQAEWEAELAFAEPRPPSPNIISLEEQVELMKEVIKWREEQDRVMSDSKPQVDRWQWEKKKVIVEDWREQKMKAIKDKVAVKDPYEGDEEDSNQGPSKLDKGKGKATTPGEDTPLWTNLKYASLDTPDGAGPAVEHIERLPEGPRRRDVVSAPELIATTIPATSSVLAPPMTLADSSNRASTPADFQFSFTTPSTYPPTTSTVTISSPLKQVADSLLADAKGPNPPETKSALDDKDYTKAPLLPISTLLTLDVDDKGESRLGDAVPRPSIFSKLLLAPDAPGLAPLINTPASTSKLPFSVRDFNVEPLEPKEPGAHSSNTIPVKSNVAFAKRPFILSRNIDARGRSRKRRRAPVEALEQQHISFSSTPDLTSESPKSMDWDSSYHTIWKPENAFVIGKQAQAASSSTPSSSSFPATLNKPHSIPDNFSRDETQRDIMSKPSSLSTTKFNVHAKPFQPASLSAPVTTSESFGAAQASFLATATGSGATPLGHATGYEQTGNNPFSYSPFDLALVSNDSHGPNGRPLSTQAPPSTYVASDLSHNKGSLGENTTRPLHGHNMGMGTTSTITHAQATGPITASRGRAMTAGAEGNSTQAVFLLPQPMDTHNLTRRALSHQRSSSLSVDLVKSQARMEENNLLRPSSSSSAGSSVKSGKLSPMPWYGLPDTSPEIDRKKIYELERREKDRAAAKAAKKRKLESTAAASTSRRAGTPTLTRPIVHASVSSKTSTTLVAPSPQESLKPTPARDPHLLQNNDDSTHPLADQNADTGLAKAALVSAKRDAPSESSSSLSAVAATPQPEMVTSQISSTKIPARNVTMPDNSQGVGESNPTFPLQMPPAFTRLPPPKSISLPDRNFMQTKEQLSSPLKRPELPYAASPLVLDERTPSKMALYQAPEEVRPMSAGLVVASEASPVFQMDNYFRPLAVEIAPQVLEEGLIGRGSPPPLEPLLDADVMEFRDIPDLPDLEAVVDDGIAVDAANIPLGEDNGAEDVAPAQGAADEVWEDEWGHLLEAVGLTGPWYGIVQNAALVMVVFNVTLGVGIFMPYIFGRTSSLMLVDPSDIVERLAPTLDRPRLLGNQFPPLWQPREDPSFSMIGKGISLLLGDLVPIFQYLAMLWRRATQFTSASTIYDGGQISASILSRIWSLLRPSSLAKGALNLVMSFLRWYQGSAACQPSSGSSYSLLNSARLINHVICSFQPERIRQQEDLQLLMHGIMSCLQLTATDRTWAITFGYGITTLCIAIHARFGARKNAYMLLVLMKVAIFLCFEAVVKPLIFGFAIDIFTLSLFPGATIQSRMTFWISAPYSTLFQHWLLGNVVVVQFLYALQDLQRFLRPGALIQIRKIVDPSTPSIREMIRRGVFSHFFKYSYTVAANLTLLWITLGLTVDTNNLLTSNFAPLRWNLRRPVSDVPLDLVILHIFFPSALRFLKLRKVIRNMAKGFFIETSRMFHLQSVLMGEVLIDPVAGGYWRVPVVENAIRLAGRPYALETDVAGNGIGQAERDMIDMQICAARRAQRVINNDYKVFFYPEHFTLRIVLFLGVLWAALFGAVWTGFTLPIRIGRLVFKLGLGMTEVHDIYSWLVGFYIFWLGSFVKYLIGREQRRWSKYLSQRPNVRFPTKLFLRHTATMLGRLVLPVIWIIVLLPVLVGALFEVYIVLPLSHWLNPGHTPSMRLAEMWAAGMVLGAIVLRAARLERPNRVPELFERIRRDGWFKIKARVLAAELGSLTIGLFTLVIAPIVVQFLLSSLAGRTIGNGNVVFKVFIPACFFILAMTVFATTVHAMAYLWVETVRDGTYLEHEIIQNLEDAPVPSDSP